jgi:putative protease
MNYYSKIGIADFFVEDQDISIGDEYYIMGPTTGVIEGKFDKLQVENENHPSQEAYTATKGDRITFSCPEKTRENDKLYKIVKTERREEICRP